MSKQGILKVPNAAGIHILAWATLVTLGVSVFALYFPLQLVLAHATANVSLAAVLFYGAAYLADRFLEKGQIWQGVLLGFGLFCAVSAVRIAVNLALLERVANGAPSGDLPIAPIWRVASLVVATSAFAIFAGMSYQLLVNRAKKERQAQALLQEQQAAQLDFLKAQINPHFLFNALNNIYSLTVTQSPEAPKMLLRLSDLLRYVIYEGRKQAVPLDKEVAQLRNFIDLFQMRHEHPVNIRFHAEGDISGKTIEPMILIPLLENCFKHTDFDTNEAAFADIQLRVDGSRLHFSTHNSFNPQHQQKDDTGGVGLANIRHRLALRYGEGHRFSTAAREARVFVVELELGFYD